jgi:hypothetical protein
VGWHATHFGDPARYAVALSAAPEKVETVANHRVIGQKHIVAGVSGGVSVQTQPLVTKAAIKIDDYGALQAEYVGADPKRVHAETWWWD